MKPLKSVFDAAEYLGLGVELSRDLPADCAGCLAPADAPAFILVNANRSQEEQRFTIAHEIGHYVMHWNRQTRASNLWLFRRRWNLHPMRCCVRYVRFCLHRVFTMELEADLYAMSVLLGTRDVSAIQVYLDKHPNKVGWFLLIALCLVVTRVRRVTSQLLA